uniref:Globin family profile domain-containing protein n=1 Tax=Acrobeloides nanus TaxID=290746 RepID=A0A914C0V9_9BILA
MGNQASIDKNQSVSTDKLLRRNKRSAVNYSPSPEGRNRSKSLQPHGNHEIRAIEHSHSARYNRRKRDWVTPPPKPRRLFSQNTQDTDRPDDNDEICPAGMTKHQKMLLQKIWMRATQDDINECAKNILAHLLRSNSHLYSFFNLVGMSDQEILNSQFFFKHSNNFAVVFDFVISNLVDDLDRVCAALESLGVHHSQLGARIEPHFWSLFLRVFEDNPPKVVHYNAEGHTAWKLMMEFIVQRVHSGYSRGLDPVSKNTLAP